MLQLHSCAPPETLCRIQPKTGPSNALKVKFKKLMTPVAVPPNCGGLASLITVYGSIAAPDAIPATRPTDKAGKLRFAVENPGQTSEQHERGADDHRFAPSDPIGNKSKQRAANDPTEGNRG